MPKTAHTKYAKSNQNIQELYSIIGPTALCPKNRPARKKSLPTVPKTRPVSAQQKIAWVRTGDYNQLCPKKVVHHTQDTYSDSVKNWQSHRHEFGVPVLGHSG